MTVVKKRLINNVGNLKKNICSQISQNFLSKKMKILKMTHSGENSSDRMPPIILKLPESITIQLLSVWINLDGLTLLDSSLCNCEERQRFLAFLSDSQFIHVEGVVGWMYGCLPWLGVRSLQVKRIDCRMSDGLIWDWNSIVNR